MADSPEVKGLTDFIIKLDTSQPVFYPGQTISGIVSLEVDAPIVIRTISINLTGKAYTKWKESKGVGKNQRTLVERTAKDMIEKSCICLLDAQDDDIGASTLQLPAGVHEYQFTFTLDDDLPSSFEGSFGYIRYLLKGKLARPGRDDMVKHAITVNELIDTNDTRYADGDGGSISKEDSCFCFKTGKFEMAVNINRCCYCPGEAIFIDADVQNNTSIDMQNLVVKLVQTTTYRTKDDTKTVTKDIAKLEGPNMLKKKQVTWSNRAFGIPATQPSIKSKVLKVRYALVFSVDVALGDDHIVNIPVTMGTIPYLPTYGRQVKYGTPEEPQGSPRANYINELSWPPPRPVDLGYPDMQHPPSFSAGVGEKRVYIGKDKDYNTYGDLHYIPVYTFSKLYDGSWDWKNEEPKPKPTQIIPVKPAPYES